jgi:hypothetical protein
MARHRTTRSRSVNHWPLCLARSRFSSIRPENSESSSISQWACSRRWERPICHLPPGRRLKQSHRYTRVISFSRLLATNNFRSEVSYCRNLKYFWRQKLFSTLYKADRRPSFLAVSAVCNSAMHHTAPTVVAPAILGINTDEIRYLLGFFITNK